jgi:hypothetical protein
MSVFEPKSRNAGFPNFGICDLFRPFDLVNYGRLDIQLAQQFV